MAVLSAALLGCSPTIERDRCDNSEFCPPIARKGDYIVQLPLSLEAAMANETPADEVISILEKSGYNVVDMSVFTKTISPSVAKSYAVENRLVPESLTDNPVLGRVPSAFMVRQKTQTLCQVGRLKYSDFQTGDPYANCRN